MSACSPETTPALGMQRLEKELTSKRKSEASWRQSTRVPTRTMLFMYENVMSPIVAKWWTNMIRKSWKQQDQNEDSLAVTQMQKFGAEPPDESAGSQDSFGSGSDSITLPPSPQELPERSLSFGAAEVRALCAQGSAQSLWHTHSCTCRPHRNHSQDKMTPIFGSFCFYRHTAHPLSSWHALSAVTAVSDRAGPEHQVTQQKEWKMFTMHNIQGWLVLQPPGSCTSPCCSGECHSLVKVKINHHKQSPRGCSSLPACSSTLFHSASPAHISAQKKTWVNLGFF